MTSRVQFRLIKQRLNGNKQLKKYIYKTQNDDENEFLGELVGDTVMLGAIKKSNRTFRDFSNKTIYKLRSNLSW